MLSSLISFIFPLRQRAWVHFSLLCLCLLLSAQASLAQVTLSERHQRIHTLYEQESYGAVVDLIDRQVKESEGNTWRDSIYQYCYTYGRATWKATGAKAGAEAAEQICDIVEREDGDPTHLHAALGDLSWLYYELGEISECLRIDLLTLDLVEEMQGASIAQRGKAHHYVAFDHGVLGDHKSAARFFLQAVAIYEESDSVLAMSLAESCNGVGSSYWHLGRNKEAEQYYLKSLEFLGDSDDLDLVTRRASAVGNLALLWEDLGDLNKSKEYVRQNLLFNDKVIALASDPSMRDEAIVNRSRTYANLAALYHSLGDFGTSRQLLERALKDRSSVLDPGNVKLLMLQEMFSDLERASGNLGKAESLLNDYLKACMEQYGERSEYTTIALSKLAGIASDKGELVKADSLFSKCIEIRSSLSLDLNDPFLALIYLERAEVYQAQGRSSEALSDMQESRARYVSIFGTQYHKVARCDILISELQQSTGAFEDAEESVRSALELLADRRLVDANDQLPRMEAFPHLLPNAIYNHVRLLRRAGRGNGEEHLEELEEAIRVLDRNKVAIQDEESKLLLLGAQQRVFHLAQHVAFESYQLDPKDSWKNTLFGLAEENRSILLKNRLNGFSSLSFAGVPDSLLEYEAQLIKGLNIDSEERTTLHDLTENEQAFTTHLRTIEKEYPAYFKLKYGRSSLDISDVQKELLTPSQSMIAYSLTDSFLYIMLIEAGSSEMLRVSSAGIGEQVLALNNALRSIDEEAYLSLSYQLYQRVFAPIRGLITNSELLIVPDEELYLLNFEALLSDSAANMDYDAHFLINDYTISYLLSASTALQFDRLDRKFAEGALALAPGFSDELKAEYLASRSDSSQVDHSFLRYIQQPFAVGTAREMEDLLAAKIMIGADADEGNFKRLAKEHGIIHLGTHTEVNNISPLYSKLVLSKGQGSSPSEDGYLHAYEIYALELNAELVVLTACETGAGRNDKGEGVRSLAHSFAYAGCPSLVMSLWKIDEKTSSQIISSFYTELSEGAAKNVALRNAKLEFLEDAHQEHKFPYYWAGVVLVGDTTPINHASVAAPWKWLLLVFVVLLLAFVIYRSRASRPA